MRSTDEEEEKGKSWDEEEDKPVGAEEEVFRWDDLGWDGLG